MNDTILFFTYTDNNDVLISLNYVLGGFYSDIYSLVGK